MRYPTYHFLKKLHEYIIDSTGGEKGVLDPGLLEAVVQRPHTKVYGYEPFKGTIAKAVAIGYAIISWHPFVDGNKRTGIRAIRNVLLINGIDMALPPYIVKYSIQAAVPEDSKIHMSEEQFAQKIMALCSTSKISRWWKHLRYEDVPYSWLLAIEWWFNRRPRSEGLTDLFAKTMLDWYAAGNIETLENTFKEWGKLQGRPTISFEIDYEDFTTES